MFDFWWGDVGLTTLACVFSVVVLLPVQLLLCFKGKSLVLQLLPVIVLSALTAFLLGISCTAPGWANLSYLLLALLSGAMLLLCGVCWVFWAIVQRARR